MEDAGQSDLEQATQEILDLKAQVTYWEHAYNEIWKRQPDIDALHGELQQLRNLRRRMKDVLEDD